MVDGPSVIEQQEIDGAQLPSGHPVTGAPNTDLDLTLHTSKLEHSTCHIGIGCIHFTGRDAATPELTQLLGHHHGRIAHVAPKLHHTVLCSETGLQEFLLLFSLDLQPATLLGKLFDHLNDRCHVSRRCTLPDPFVKVHLLWRHRPQSAQRYRASYLWEIHRQRGLIQDLRHVGVHLLQAHLADDLVRRVTIPAVTTGLSSTGEGNCIRVHLLPAHPFQQCQA
mmetsp:Transcript_78608/g.173497  ORF Transcript_78608/g.173497 Transcript_78608/m.173497 type:complete len:223 (-) Transcript_78608:868-1536(-)